MTLPKTVSIEKFNQPKDIVLGASMTQSQMLQVSSNIRDLEGKKTMPSYKKVSHFTPAPSPTSFKKPSPIVNKLTTDKASQ